MRMRIVNNEQEARTEVVETNNEHNEMQNAGKTAIELLNGTNIGQWGIITTLVVIIFIVVPILPIAVAFFFGHYVNYWLDKHK